MNNNFRFTKPDNWNTLPLYKKISFYKTILNDSYSPYVDKLSAKKIVKDLCGDKIQIPKVIRILDGPYDIFQSDLNTNHIIKSSHGSGWNINITDNTDTINCIRTLYSWNKLYTLHNENQYKYIKPKFFIEEKVDCKYSGKSGNADVFMFRCIFGKPFVISIKRGKVQNNYNLNWDLIEAPNFDIDKPQELDRMLELATILSKPFEFVRIDFYISKQSDIYFSEFTFTPNAGYQLYSDSLETYFGTLWK